MKAPQWMPLPLRKSTLLVPVGADARVNDLTCDLATILLTLALQALQFLSVQEKQLLSLSGCQCSVHSSAMGRCTMYFVLSFSGRCWERGGRNCSASGSTTSLSASSPGWPTTVGRNELLPAYPNCRKADAASAVSVLAGAFGSTTSLAEMHTEAGLVDGPSPERVAQEAEALEQAVAGAWAADAGITQEGDCSQAYR
eukprot:scaffold86963_cov17-Tisochrysis_lutea.AAC.3